MNGAGEAVTGVSIKKIQRPRKSRSAGLRCRTGCGMCRQRHKKCDESHPICGNCARAGRNCVYPALPERDSAPNSLRAVSADIANIEDPYQPISEVAVTFEDRNHRLQPNIDSVLNHEREIQPVQPPYQYLYSPTASSTDILPADLASVRWLDLLAADAVNDHGFSFLSTPFPLEEISVQRSDRDVRPVADSLRCLPSSTADAEMSDWQSDKSIVLQDHEIDIFRNFVDRASLWLDLFDTEKHFSTHAIRLALRNTGLMKAILALSARHLSLLNNVNNNNGALSDSNLAVQYYYETLHYVRNALQYNSYTYSEELLATTLVISTYEMLDESGSGWQRHLKGVFWIQRSQDVDGASGGLRQAVWWAWLRQDIWAAFKEKRRVLSFWKPTKNFQDLNSYELANRAIYLFAQAVNYCANVSNLDALAMADPSAIQLRAEKGDELLAMLDRWKSFLGEQYEPLPSPASSSIFPAIWIHPPQFGLALQVHYFARILVILHRPAMSGFNGYLRLHKTLSDAVNMICGIALALKDEACQIMSAQCLYGAGLCVQDQLRRSEIITLINACESRSGWPMSSLKSDLQAHWEKTDAESTINSG